GAPGSRYAGLREALASRRLDVVLAALHDACVENTGRSRRGVRSSADDDLAGLGDILAGGSKVALAYQLAVEEGIGTEFLHEVELDWDGKIGGLAFRNDLQDRKST